MLKNALEPSWEARFESNSYGFRPGRSAHDAVKHCWLSLNGNTQRPWILDADIRGAFDNISHDYIMEGFNFLGFSFGRYRGKCLFKPEKKKVHSFLRKVSQFLSEHWHVKAETLIRKLNPILRGWSNYYKHAVSKGVFSFVSHRIWKMLWMWCLRRHPNKGKHWVKLKYFGAHGWRFSTKAKLAGQSTTLCLFEIGEVRIQRHVKVRGDASPDDSKLAEYWRQRAERKTLKPRSLKQLNKPMEA